MSWGCTAEMVYARLRAWGGWHTATGLRFNHSVQSVSNALRHAENIGWVERRAVKGQKAHEWRAVVKES